MITRAWFFDRKVDVDPEAKKAAVVPMHGNGVAAAVALAVTPASLAAAHLSGASRLTPAGWVFMIGYAIAVVATLAIVFGSNNRRVDLAFDGAHVPFAIVKDARTLAKAISSAKSFDELDAAATKAGKEPLKQANMLLALLVLPGWMFAWAAWR